MSKPTLEQNLQWMVDKATANSVCEQSPDYTRMIWSKDRRVLVVDKITGEIVWMNDAEKKKRERAS